MAKCALLFCCANISSDIIIFDHQCGLGDQAAMRDRSFCLACAASRFVFVFTLIAISNVASAAGKSHSTRVHHRSEFRKLDKPVNEGDFNFKKQSSLGKKGSTTNTRRFDPYKNFKFK